MPFPTYTKAELSAVIAGVVAFVREGRERFAPFAEPLSVAQCGTMQPFFATEVLARARIVPPERADLENPDFFYRGRKRGFSRMPDFAHLAEVTFDDTMLFHAAITDRLLFHALVHVVQYGVLGVEDYVELYLRNFIRTGLHVVVPFEVHAYELDERFARAPLKDFSVEREVRRWLKKGLYDPA